MENIFEILPCLVLTASPHTVCLSSPVNFGLLNY